MAFGEINHCSDVKRRVRPLADLRGRSMIEFPADKYIVKNLPLEKRPDKSPIAVASARIDAASAAAIRSPFMALRSPTLLQPDRQKRLNVAATQLAVGVTSGNFQQRKYAYLRKAGGFLDEPIFRADFCVAITVLAAALCGRVVGQRRDEMKLHIGNNTIIHLDMRRSSRPVARGLGVLRRDVEFPMPILDRFRVIRCERRAG